MPAHGVSLPMPGTVPAVRYPRVLLPYYPLSMALLMLILSVLALVVGPGLFRVFSARQYFFRLMDGFVVVVITGIVILEVLPELLAHHPVAGIILLMLGFAGPTILEQLFHRAARQVHRTALLIGVAGIVAHTIVDGMVLFESPASGGALLGLGVMLHRLPVGITIWWLMEPRYGKKAAWAVLGLMVVGTVAGFFMGAGGELFSSAESILWLKAFVAGAILHVVIHRPHVSEASGGNVFKWAEGTGNLVGLGVLLLLIIFHVETGVAHREAGILSGDTADIFWGMALESAPALLLAYFFGGLISEFLPATSIRWMRKGPAWGRSVKGMAIGLPLPICTCGVLPLYRTLIKKGAPPTAAMAFLIATPELGLDALLISLPLLGGDMTLVRLVAAATIALLIGWSVGLWTEKTTPAVEIMEAEADEKVGAARGDRLKKGLREGFGGLVDDTAPWILVGLLVAALAHPVLSQGWIQQLHPGVEVLIFAMLGLPIYVCASGATPIVAVLLINGVSPGAALAFLLTGPATNVSTFGILSQVHRRNIAIVFGIATMTIAVSLGLLLNTMLPSLTLLSAQDLNLDESGIFQKISLIVLFGVFLVSLLRQGARAFVGEVTSNFRLSSLHRHNHAHTAPAANCECKSGTHCEQC